MGSGHFVVVLFERLVALRLAEEKPRSVSVRAAPPLLRHGLFPRDDEFSSVADHVGFQAISLFEGLYRNTVSIAQAGK